MGVVVGVGRGDQDGFILRTKSTLYLRSEREREREREEEREECLSGHRARASDGMRVYYILPFIIHPKIISSSVLKDEVRLFIYMCETCLPIEHRCTRRPGCELRAAAYILRFQHTLARVLFTCYPFEPRITRTTSTADARRLFFS